MKWDVLVLVWPFLTAMREMSSRLKLRAATPPARLAANALLRIKKRDSSARRRRIHVDALVASILCWRDDVFAGRFRCAAKFEGGCPCASVTVSPSNADLRVLRLLEPLSLSPYADAGCRILLRGAPPFGGFTPLLPNCHPVRNRRSCLSTLQDSAR